MVVVHIVGLPGAGKTTLATGLADTLGWPRLGIGMFRHGRPATWEGEDAAWDDLERALVRLGWRSSLVETSGLNGRMAGIEARAPPGALVRVKLVGRRDVLKARVRARDGDGRPAAWVYQDELPDRATFIDRFHERMAVLPADLTVRTDLVAAAAVLERTTAWLERWMASCGRHAKPDGRGRGSQRAPDHGGPRPQTP